MSIRCRLIAVRYEMTGTYVVKVEERCLSNVGETLGLDTGEFETVQVELAPGLFLNVTVSEWGTLALSDKPIQTGKVED